MGEPAAAAVAERAGAKPTNGAPVGNNDAREFTVFLLGSLTLAIVVALVGEGADARSLAASALAAGLAALYWVWCRPALRTGQHHRSTAFVAVAIPLAGLLFQMRPVFMTSLFGLYPLCFAAIRRFAHQALAAAALSATAALGQANDSAWNRSGWVAGVMIGVISFFFAIVLGRWVTRMREYTLEQMRLVSELTHTRAELAQAQHDAGVRAERERLSAEIHDTLAQGFGSILMLSRSARRAIGSDDARADELLALVVESALTNLDEARALVDDLAPAPLQQHRLVEAIGRIAQRFQTETGVLTSVSVVGSSVDAGLSQAEEVVLLRAVQESLTNVGRHASARTVSVELRLDERPVSARVHDDGIGFDAQEQERIGRASPVSEPTRHGLSGLRARLAAIGGDVRIASCPGAGTDVVVTLP